MQKKLLSLDEPARMMADAPFCPELQIHEMDEESRQKLSKAIADCFKASRDRVQGDDIGKNGIDDDKIESEEGGDGLCIDF